VGASGTGKTTLGALLGVKGATRRIKANGHYVLSSEVEEGKISGLVFSKTTVLPGQLHFRRTRVWEPYLKKLAADHYKGVIHVVSGGYHSFDGASYRDLYPGKPFKSPSEFLKHHLEICREREREVIKALSDALQRRRKDIWIMTLITKEDIWAKQHGTICSLYSQGPYQDLLQETERRMTIKPRHVRA